MTDGKNGDSIGPSFLIFKMYVAFMFEWDKPIDKNKLTQEIMSILKTGIFK